ncbi:hypothetical protein PVAP13_5KG218300 [Panicum virgatum]|uniref:Uncharacterized protein n=1 Tax=Panicum virgatum TaxID=38727 RepID=A0A8T0SEZ1_PANVG|nr:hypothetical protein PVAP13_5KG218300 [Panicum virgatum]
MGAAAQVGTVARLHHQRRPRRDERKPPTPVFPPSPTSLLVLPAPPAVRLRLRATGAGHCGSVRPRVAPPTVLSESRRHCLPTSHFPANHLGNGSLNSEGWVFVFSILPLLRCSLFLAMLRRQMVAQVN